MLNIIYISYYYPPSNNIGASRSFNQVSALRELGHKVIVFYAANDNKSYIKNSYVNHKDDYCLTVESSYTYKNVSTRSLIRRAIIRLFSRSIIDFFRSLQIYIFGERRDWLTDKIFYDAKQKLIGIRPDLIISTCSPLENHFFASRIKEAYNCFWIAEFRDCWSFNTMGFATSPDSYTSKLLRTKEKSALKGSDLILAVTPHIEEYYKKYFSVQTYLIYSGWVEHDNRSLIPKITNQNDSKIKIIHLGSLLHGRRSPEVIFKIFSENKIIREKFRLYFIGRDSELFKDSLSEVNRLSESIILHKEIDMFQARVEGRSADYLLILMMNHPHEKHTLTGKIYEYVAIGKPIIIYDPVGSEASKFIQRHSLGYICKNKEELTNCLLDINHSKNLIKLNDEIAKKFNVKSCFTELLDYVDIGSNNNYES